MNGLPSWLTSITLGGIVGTLLALGTVLGALWLMTRPLRQMAGTIEQLREDWFGVPGRPGFPAIPGVPERLALLEAAQRSDRDLLEKINHELHPNSGGSMRDQFDKARVDMDRMARDMGGRMQELTRVVRDIETMRRVLENPQTLRVLARRLDVAPMVEGDPERETG